MNQLQKTNKNLAIKKELNHDVRELKANNKLHPKALKKDSEDRQIYIYIYMNDVILSLRIYILTFDISLI
jgi:hypothetical protein